MNVDTVSRNNHKPNFMKIRPVEAKLFHADGETNTTKLTVAFYNFANMPKEYALCNTIFPGFKKVALSRTLSPTILQPWWYTTRQNPK